MKLNRLTVSAIFIHMHPNVFFFLHDLVFVFVFVFANQVITTVEVGEECTAMHIFVVFN